MKKTLLISTALLFSVITFAQTTVKNSEAIKDNTTIQTSKSGSKVNNSGNASGATSIQSHTATKAENKSYAELKEQNEKAAKAKQTLVMQANDKEQKSEKMASKDHSVSASAHSNTSVHASAEDNNYSNNASINDGATVSTARLKSKGTQIKNEEKAAVTAKTDATLENGNHVAAQVNKIAEKGGEKINATSTAAVKSGAATAHIVKPRPASIKMNTMVKTNAGIRIR